MRSRVVGTELSHCELSHWIRVAACLALLLGVPAVLSAQPFGLWTAFAGNGTAGASNGWLQIPDSPALNPTSAITIEAWVLINEPFANAPCRSIVGKDYTHAYWVGACRTGSGGATLRSYVRGTASLIDGGVIPNGTWINIAVTSDGATRKHYIDGELVATHSETGPPTGSTSPLQIGGDASYEFSPNGLVNEVRLWNVARTQDQIRAAINVPLRSAQPGLVAVWPMFVATDALGVHNGSFAGNIPPILGPPAESNCGASGASALCLQGHFLVTATFRTGPPGSASGNAGVAVASPDSGIFWFFAPSTWEVMVKVIDGCALNNHWWVFTAATTNVYYQLNVTDVQNGQPKIYFNYPGPPAPAVTDTSAFPCP
ncbi:MAG TPA: LamG domain-containing protein [Thermoanaerobaculia bacterium]